MGQLTIDIHYDRDDEIFDIEIEAYNCDADIQSELEFDNQFQELLNALSSRFVEIVDNTEKLPC